VDLFDDLLGHWDFLQFLEPSYGLKTSEHGGKGRNIFLSMDARLENQCEYSASE
tara:strand:- start:396 stop:557 length:162 start_codon:yes stop_codon:yes gene_type:complete